MTRKLLVVNMSNWGDEHYLISGGDDKPREIAPGEWASLYVSDNQTITVGSIKVGEPNGYQPPAFPMDAIDFVVEERTSPPKRDKSVIH